MVIADLNAADMDDIADRKNYGLRQKNNMAEQQLVLFFCHQSSIFCHVHNNQGYVCVEVDIHPNSSLDYANYDTFLRSDHDRTST